MSGHTVLPWTAENHRGCKAIKGGKAGRHRQARYTLIAYTVGLSNEAKDAANAALLVKAVNMHDRLVEALGDAAKALEETAAWLDGENITAGRFGGTIHGIRHDASKARALLAEPAEGE